jgi:hypothetical protein
MTTHEIVTIARNSGFSAVASADGQRVEITLTHQTVNMMDVQMIIGFDNVMTRSTNGVIVTGC